MDATSTVTLYAVILALCSFGLASVAIWSRRELRMRLIALGLGVAMAPVAWFAFSELPGKPSGMSAEDFREKYRCATIYPVEDSIMQGVGLYILAKKKDAREPEYLFVAWNMRLAASLQKSMRVAKINRKGSIIYGAASCREEDGDADGTGKGKKGKGKGKGKGPQLPGSSGQEEDGGDGFTFYPDPVPPLPEKNYGPLFEGPIQMPEKR